MPFMKKLLKFLHVRFTITKQFNYVNKGHRRLY